MTAYLVDPDFLSTFNIKLKSGRDFLKNSPLEYQTAFLLNELAVKKLELGEGVGKQVELQGKRGIVVGVVKDFNFASLHNEKEPLIISLDDRPFMFHFLNLKIRTNDFNKTISFIEKTWKEMEPVQPFNYRFLDETLDKQYAQDSRMAKIIFIFTVLAVIIACLGLFGLTMMEGLSAYLGSVYEISLHNVEDYNHSVVKIMPFNIPPAAVRSSPAPEATTRLIAWK